MRLLALLLNAGLLLFIGSMFFAQGLPEPEDFWLLVLLTCAPLVSILALVGKGLWPKNSWLGLYLERKRTEEANRLAVVKSKIPPATRNGNDLDSE